MIVPKPGPGDSYRFCVDFVDVNKITKPIKFPIPIIEDIMQSLGGCNYFCKLDLAKGYFQIAVEEESKKYTTFVSRQGTYCFNRMPLGPRNAPAVF